MRTHLKQNFVPLVVVLGLLVGGAAVRAQQPAVSAQQLCRANYQAWANTYDKLLSQALTQAGTLDGQAGQRDREAQVFEPQIADSVRLETYYNQQLPYIRAQIGQQCSGGAFILLVYVPKTCHDPDPAIATTYRQIEAQQQQLLTQAQQRTADLRREAAIARQQAASARQQAQNWRLAAGRHQQSREVSLRARDACR